jgi:hypothetical protein
MAAYSVSLVPFRDFYEGELAVLWRIMSDFVGVFGQVTAEVRVEIPER